jgi:hypothetical protein
MSKTDWTNVLTWVLVPFVAAVFYGAVVAMLVRGCDNEPPMKTVVTTDTLVMRDTIHDSVPKLVYKNVVRYVKETPISLHDTVYMSKNEENVYLTDSGEVIVPISRKVYTDDSTYRAVVSGYKATLDQIDVYRKQTVITNTVTHRRRWNVGPTGGLGYGLTTGRPDIFIGIGVTYNILPP